MSSADDGNTTSVLRRLGGAGLPVSHLYAAVAANSSGGGGGARTDGSAPRRRPLYVVPNVVHFIWFADSAARPLTFINYVSVVSAHRIQRPDSIWLHCNHLPAGEWWERLWRQVNTHTCPPPVSGWWHSTVVERQSLTGELSLSCARPAADG